MKLTASVPIRIRLTLWFVLIFAAAQLLFIVGAAAWMKRSMNADALDNLRSQTAEITQVLASIPPGTSFSELQKRIQHEFGDEIEGQWLRITTPDGSTVALTPAAAGIHHTFSNGEQHTLRVAGRHVRFLATSVEVAAQRYLVVTGAVVDAQAEALEDFREGLLVLSPLLLLIAGVGSYWISRKALRPVDELASSAQQITDSNLHQRLPVANTNDELSRLANTLNDMLSRIDSAFQRVRQFTADASHELRTPLSLIRTEAEIALRRPRSGEEYRDALEQIFQESQRTASLLESMLALARSEARQERTRFAAVDCAAMLNELAHDWTAVMKEAGLRLTASGSTHPLMVEGDAFALRRLLVILLDNARKYTPPGGEVRLNGRREYARVLLEVEDTGLGIAPEHLPHIFDRFYRADAARTRSAGGVGLGLALAQRIAQQHGATLEVASEFGQGTRFTASLPALHTRTASAGVHEVFPS